MRFYSDYEIISKDVARLIFNNGGEVVVSTRGKVPSLLDTRISKQYCNGPFETLYDLLQVIYEGELMQFSIVDGKKYFEI